MPNQLNYLGEVYRKCVHIASSIIAICLWHLNIDIVLFWLLGITVIFVLFDYLRKKFSKLNQFYYYFFGQVTRLEESQKLSGASWVFMGASITVILTFMEFISQKSAIIALLVMSLSDSAAAIIGIKYGATKLLNKSLEGSLAFFVITCVIVFLLASSLSLTSVLIIAFFVTLVELWDTPKLNDNISIPVATAVLLTLFGI